MKLHILIGGAGFLGRHLLEELWPEYNEDRFLIIDHYEKTDLMKDLPLSNNQNIMFLECNLEELSLWDEYCCWRSREHENDYDGIYIYHFASPVGVLNHNESTFYRAMYINQNVYNFACNLLTFKSSQSSRNIYKFFYMSSSELYGSINENTFDTKLDTFVDLSKNLGGFRSDYIYQKFLGEELFKQLSKYYSVNILRLFNIVGKYQDPNKGVFNLFIDNIVFDKLCIINDSIRSYTPFNIFTDTVINLINNKCSSGFNITNVCSEDFKLSLTTEELYMYLHQYLVTNYEGIKSTSKNFTFMEFKGEIKYRGSTNTISYLNFVKNFGWIIDEYIVWAHTELKRTKHYMLRELKQ